jgi:hypothetical protein
MCDYLFFKDYAVFLQELYNFIITIAPIFEFTKAFTFLTVIEIIAFLLIILGSLIIVTVAYRSIKLLTDIIGDYQKRDPSKESKLKRIGKMMWVYLISTFPVYLAILTLIPLPENPQPFQISIIFPISLSLMISLRIFTNPTTLIYTLFYQRKPEEITFLDKIELNEVHNLVKSFFFSFILGGIFVLITGIAISFQRLSNNFLILWNTPYLFSIIVISYFVSLLILTYISEICILEKG